jgi:hypothetical protein
VPTQTSRNTNQQNAAHPNGSDPCTQSPLQRHVSRNRDSLHSPENPEIIAGGAFRPDASATPAISSVAEPAMIAPAVARATIRLLRQRFVGASSGV